MNQLIVSTLDEQGRPTDRVNLAEPRGANRFLLAPNGNLAITRFLEQINEDRQQLNRGNRHRRQAARKLEGLYMYLFYLADETSDEAFGVLDPERELVALIRHMKEIIPQIAESSVWKNHGELSKYDDNMLACLIAFNKRLVFVNKVLEEKLFQSMVSLLEATPHMPNAAANETFMSAFGSAHLSLLHSHNPPNAEQSLKTLEKAGVLTQMICLATQPSPEMAVPLKVLEDLAGCVNLLRKKFAEDQPAREMLEAVLDGEQGYRPLRQRNQAVMRRLENVYRIAKGVSKSNANEETELLYKSCRYCDKIDRDPAFQKALMRCSRCQTTYYCSKECQRADWKEHKKSCRTNDRKQVRTWESGEALVSSFVQKNVGDVIHELAEKTRNCSNKDWVLELDFKVDETGVAPSLKIPPTIKLNPLSGYLEGNRELEPDWFYKGTSVYEANVRIFLSGLRDHANRMTEDRLLTVSRNPDGCHSVCRLLIQDPGHMNPLFAPRALAVYRKVVLDNDGDFHELETHFSTSFAKELQRNGMMKRLSQLAMTGPGN